MCIRDSGCTDHFWEARFQSQALRSERALLAAMAYADLNPVRARMALTPEASKFTSIRVRIRRDNTAREQHGSVRRMLERGELHHFETPIRPLLQFSDTVNPLNPTVGSQGAADRLPMRAPDYLELVDATGRLVVTGKRGRIDASVDPIL